VNNRARPGETPGATVHPAQRGKVGKKERILFIMPRKGYFL